MGNCCSCCCCCKPDIILSPLVIQPPNRPPLTRQGIFMAQLLLTILSNNNNVSRNQSHHDKKKPSAPTTFLFPFSRAEVSTFANYMSEVSELVESRRKEKAIIDDIPENKQRSLNFTSKEVQQEMIQKSEDILSSKLGSIAEYLKTKLEDFITKKVVDSGDKSSIDDITFQVLSCEFCAVLKDYRKNEKNEKKISNNIDSNNTNNKRNPLEAPDLKNEGDANFSPPRRKNSQNNKQNRESPPLPPSKISFSVISQKSFTRGSNTNNGKDSSLSEPSCMMNFASLSSSSSCSVSEFVDPSQDKKIFVISVPLSAVFRRRSSTLLLDAPFLLDIVVDDEKKETDPEYQSCSKFEIVLKKYLGSVFNNDDGDEQEEKKRRFSHEELYLTFRGSFVSKKKNSADDENNDDDDDSMWMKRVSIEEKFSESSDIIDELVVKDIIMADDSDNNSEFSKSSEPFAKMFYEEENRQQQYEVEKLMMNNNDTGNSPRPE